MIREAQKLLWKATGLGDGMAPVAAAGGVLFTVGIRDEKEMVLALDGAGRLLWSQTIAAPEREFRGMRFLHQRVPTVDDDQLYVVTPAGGSR